jgi:hypothetical protein
MQLSINPSGQSIGVCGQIIDDAGVVDPVSGFNEETVNQIPFGCGVVQGVADDGVKLPSASTDKPVGISAWSMWHLPAGINDPSGNPSGDLGTVGLMPRAGVTKFRKGRILVPIDAGISIAPQDRPWLRFRTDGALNTQPGTFSNAQDGGSNLIDMTRLGVFVSSIFVVDNPTGGSTNAAILEVDFTSRNT